MSGWFKGPVLAGALVLSCASTPVVTPTTQAKAAKTAKTAKTAKKRSQAKKKKRKLRTRGKASYYADSLAGRLTASGVPYDPRAATCAHRRLRFGTVVEIVVNKTGKKATCTINDRGPFVRGRIIDASRAVAEKLDMIDAGVVDVTLRVLP